MLSKKKRKSPCPFASSKKPSKRKELSNSFDKNRADVLAASDRGSRVEQEKLIALDEEKQSRWENETVSSSWSKIEDKGKDEPAELDSQESLQHLAGQTIFAQSLLTLLRDLAKDIFRQEQHLSPLCTRNWYEIYC